MPGTLVSSRSVTRMPLSTSIPAASASAVRGGDPEADDDEVAVVVGPMGGAPRRDGWAPPNPPQRGVRPPLDAALEMQVAVDPGQLCAQHPLQRERRPLDDR